MKIIQKAIRKLRQGGLGEVVRYFPHWIVERYHERRLGINTAGYLSLKDTGLEGSTDPSGAYEPAPYRSIFRALDLIEIKPGHDVFLDYGSGKGRAVVAAATYPFKKVIGVELSENLNAVARENLKRAKRHFRSPEVEVLTADAMQYRLPDDVTVVFLYGPFFGEPMRAVVKQIEESLQRAMRKMTVVYRYPHWTDDPFDGNPRFKLMEEIVGYTDAGERLRMYAAVPSKGAPQ